jgi:monovalent cation/hydrogen antiporter
VHAELSIVALLLAAAAVAGVSARYGYSSPLVLTAVGIGLSFVPGVPSYPLTSQLALTGFLPPLLYAAAIRTPFVDMRRNVRPILSLSIGLVLVTTLAVAGVAVRLLPDLALPAALALGAVVAPPDAVAATAVARRVGMPRRIVTILEGESLFNDATALVTFRTALGALAGSASVLGAGGDFLQAIVVGVAVGLGVALVMTPVRRWAGDDPVLDTSLSLLVPYVAYLAAEQLHGSGVLGVVVAGLVLGHRSPDIQSAASRVTERTLWRTVQFVLENVVFLLIGLQLRSLAEQARSSSLGGGRILLLCLAVTATVILVRIVWMFPVTYVQHQLPAIKRKESPPPWQNVAVLSWAGMRGVVTLAAGFALVGQGVQYGEVLLIVAFSVVAGTLLVQGSTLPWVVRLLRVEGPDRAQDALQQALVLQRAVDAGRERLEKEARDDTPDDVVDSLRSWGERIAHSVWERLGTSDGREETPTRTFRRLRVAMLRAERQVVVDVHRSGKVPAEVLEGVMERLDQEEAMLIAFGEGAATGQSDLLTPKGAEECEHLRSEPLVAVPGDPDGCQDCIAMGEHAWVALRMCLRCGHVGCCDSSPRRHASAHYGDIGHPVMRSIELGEGWRWCYVDSVAA